MATWDEREIEPDYRDIDDSADPSNEEMARLRGRDDPD